MGKILIIKNADFSQNGFAGIEYVADSVPVKTLAWHNATSAFPNRIWTNFSIDGISCYYPTIYGAVVKCNPNSYIKLFAVKADGSFRLLQMFNIPSDVTSGAWRQLVLDTPANMGEGEYLGVCSNSMYYIEDGKSTGYNIGSGGNDSGVSSSVSTITNTFSFNRIYSTTQS